MFETAGRVARSIDMAVHLPLLARLYVASPCTADWSEMAGDDRARHCGKCKQTVYNLSDMTREAAEALLFEKNGDLCVRYFARRDGTILTADCSVGVRQARKRKLVAAGAALLASVGAVGGGAYQIMAAENAVEEVHFPMMGAVARPQTAPADDVHVMMGGSAAMVPVQNPEPQPHVLAPPSVSAPVSMRAAKKRAK
jgi:hypothetical protein